MTKESAVHRPRHGFPWWIVRTTAILLSITVHSILAWGEEFDGPDGLKYLGIASQMSNPWDLFRSDLGDDRYWAIGYPAFLAILRASPEHVPALVIAIQILMVIATGLMVYLILKPLSEPVASLALAAVVLSPTLIAGAQMIGYEVLLAFLLTLSVTSFWVSNQRVQEEKPGWIILAMVSGVSLGIGLVVQPKVLALLPVLLLVLLIGPRFMRWVRALFCAAGLAAVMAVLMVRNFVAFGTFSPLTTNGPINIWLGNNPESPGYYQWVDPPPGWESNLFRLVTDFALGNPDAFVRLQLNKISESFFPMYIGDASIDPIARVVYFFVQWVWAAGIAVTFVIFLCALILRIKDPSIRLWPIALFVFVGIMLNLPFIAERRMRIPFEPLLLAVVVPTVWLLVRRWKRPSEPRGHPAR